MDKTKNELFPIVKKVSVSTIANGQMVEPKDRIKKRKRILKFKDILNKKDFFDTISKDDYEEIMIEKKTEYIDGLVSVQPMRPPEGHLMYLDFKYGENQK